MNIYSWRISILMKRQRNHSFFELVRSYSAPGKPIEIINIRLPNNNPEKPFYYRLRALDGGIVHKRHITFKLDKNLRQRIEVLFFKNDWTVIKPPVYGYEQRASPFITFADIPTQARYQFMLNTLLVLLSVALFVEVKSPRMLFAIISG